MKHHGKFTDIETINTKSFLDKNSRKGLAGLNNIGSSDFLFAIKQALSCCEFFIKFILIQRHKYLNDKYITKENTSLISFFDELIYQMFVGTNKEISPSKFNDFFLIKFFKILILIN